MTIIEVDIYCYCCNFRLTEFLNGAKMFLLPAVIQMQFLSVTGLLLDFHSDALSSLSSTMLLSLHFTFLLTIFFKVLANSFGDVSLCILFLLFTICSGYWLVSNVIHGKT